MKNALSFLLRKGPQLTQQIFALVEAPALMFHLILSSFFLMKQITGFP
jgi:hypothetical protein